MSARARWRAVRLVARREFTERLRDRSFLVSTVITVLILLGVIVVPQPAGVRDEPTFEVAVARVRSRAERAAIEAQAAAFNVDVVLHRSTMPRRHVGR